MGQALQWHGLNSQEWAQIAPIDRHEVARLCRKHGEMGKPLAQDYMRAARRETFSSAGAALDRLRLLSGELELGKTGLTVTVHDGELKRWCERHADEIAGSCDDWTRRAGVVEAWRYAQKRVEECGLTFPDGDMPKNPTKQDYATVLARVFDAKWWRLQVRKLQARKIEAVAREIQLVHKNAGIYASHATVNRRRAQKARNREALTNMEAVNDAGEAINLLELAKSSVANPVNRRAELMVRIKGFEQCAEAAGHVGLFLTLTAPSKYHRMTYIKKLGTAYPNKKYQGYTPRQAQGYFCEVWSQIRAKLWREGIRPYGFRVAEPHHDGTPHWHLLLFVDPKKAGQLEAIVRDYGLKEDGEEFGAKQRRVTTVRIDPDKGSAAGYIAKYISKNIDGHAMDEDLYGNPAEDSAARIDAWAAAWGIRQFQQIGGASVTVWRELRRLQFDLEAAHTHGMDNLADEDRAKVLQAWFAADSADWAAYTMLQGGMTVRRDEQLIRTQYEDDGLGQYYQPVKRLTGIIAGAVQSIVTRVTRWTIQRAGTAAKLAGHFEDGTELTRSEKRAESLQAWQEQFGPRTGCTWGHEGEPERPAPFSGLPLKAAFAAAWTRGNNCTGAKPPGGYWPATRPPGGGASMGVTG
ncbi:replication endonuclease [Marinobacter alkaliphilus]|uniref:replication endonuclease n=1 Tax=Marinobacter alkaliphilus TaxID=254719 RepID=UPI003D767788